MYELQKRIAIAVGKARTPIDKIKNLSETDLLDIFAISPEKYDTKIGN